MIPRKTGRGEFCLCVLCVGLYACIHGKHKEFKPISSLSTSIPILSPLSYTGLMYICVSVCTRLCECFHYIYFPYRMVMEGVGKEKLRKVKLLTCLNITYTQKVSHANKYIQTCKNEIFLHIIKLHIRYIQIHILSPYTCIYLHLLSLLVYVSRCI